MEDNGGPDDQGPHLSHQVGDVRVIGERHAQRPAAGPGDLDHLSLRLLEGSEDAAELGMLIADKPTVARGARRRLIRGSADRHRHSYDNATSVAGCVKGGSSDADGVEVSSANHVHIGGIVDFDNRASGHGT